jgi:hypothetical protein
VGSPVKKRLQFGIRLRLLWSEAKVPQGRRVAGLGLVLLVWLAWRVLLVLSGAAGLCLVRLWRGGQTGQVG